MKQDSLRKIAYPIIKKIAEQSRNKSFAYYEGKDIEQQVWVFCLEALKRYDPGKSKQNSIEKKIEHFLNSHVSNRLKNLMRDKYFRPSKNKSDSGSKTKMNIVNALPLDICDIDNHQQNSSSHDPLDILETQDRIDHIVDNLDGDLLKYFYMLIENEKIPRKITNELYIAVRQLLREFNDE